MKSFVIKNSHILCMLLKKLISTDFLHECINGPFCHVKHRCQWSCGTHQLFAISLFFFSGKMASNSNTLQRNNTKWHRQCINTVLVAAPHIATRKNHLECLGIATFLVLSAIAVRGCVTHISSSQKRHQTVIPSK